MTEGYTAEQQDADLRTLLRLLAEVVNDDYSRHRAAGRLQTNRSSGHWRRHTYVTVAQAATLLAVSPATVKRRIYRGRLPAERFNRTWLIRRSDIARMSPACRPPSTGAPREFSASPREFSASSSGPPQDTTGSLAS